LESSLVVEGIQPYDRGLFRIDAIIIDRVYRAKEGRTELPIDAVWCWLAGTRPRQAHVWVAGRRTDHVISGL